MADMVVRILNLYTHGTAQVVIIVFEQILVHGLIRIGVVLGDKLNQDVHVGAI